MLAMKKGKLPQKLGKEGKKNRKGSRGKGKG